MKVLCSLVALAASTVFCYGAYAGDPSRKADGVGDVNVGAALAGEGALWFLQTGVVKGAGAGAGAGAAAVEGKSANAQILSGVHLEASEPRDHGSGMPTGKRMHNPFIFTSTPKGGGRGATGGNSTGP